MVQEHWVFVSSGLHPNHDHKGLQLLSAARQKLMLVATSARARMQGVPIKRLPFECLLAASRVRPRWNRPDDSLADRSSAADAVAYLTMVQTALWIQ